MVGLGLLPELIAAVAELQAASAAQERAAKNLAALLLKFIPSDDPRTKNDLYRPR